LLLKARNAHHFLLAYKLLLQLRANLLHVDLLLLGVGPGYPSDKVLLLRLGEETAAHPHPLLSDFRSALEFLELDFLLCSQFESDFLLLIAQDFSHSLYKIVLTDSSHSLSRIFCYFEKFFDGRLVDSKRSE